MASSEPFKSASSVQELAKELKFPIPQCYVQEYQEPTFVPGGSSSLPTIPVVDMNDFITGKSNIEIQLKNLRSICQEWGIFQLMNHGVNNSVMEKVKYEIEEFFKLPIEDKNWYKLKPGEVEGYGQTLLQAQAEKIDWVDRFYMITNPLHRRKPDLLPELPPSLRNALEKYFEELQKLAMVLFGLVGEAVDIVKSEMVETFENGMQSVRMNYYPPCPQPDSVIGLTPHSDATGITILLQVNNVDGLQVKKDGIWIPVRFDPNALLVNVGDILEIMSNGVFNSIEHRATINSTKERISLAMFFNPKFEAEVGPSKSLLKSTGNAPLYRTLVMDQYLKEFFARKLDGKTYLETLKMKNVEAGDI